MSEITATTICQIASPLRLPNEDLYGSAFTSPVTTPSCSSPKYDFIAMPCNSPRPEISTPVSATKTASPYQHLLSYAEAKVLFYGLVGDQEDVALSETFSDLCRIDEQTSVGLLSNNPPQGGVEVQSSRRSHGLHSLPIPGFEEHRATWTSNPLRLSRLRLGVRDLQAEDLQVPPPPPNSPAQRTAGTLQPPGRTKPFAEFHCSLTPNDGATSPATTRNGVLQFTLFNEGDAAPKLKSQLEPLLPKPLCPERWPKLVYVPDASRTPEHLSSPASRSGARTFQRRTTKRRVDDLWASDPQQLESKRAAIRKLQTEIARGPQISNASPTALKDEGAQQKRREKSATVFDRTPAHHDWDTLDESLYPGHPTIGSVAAASTSSLKPMSASVGSSPPPEISANSPEDDNNNEFGKLLAHLTRLDDREFHKTPASHVRFPEASETSLLERALKLAQVTVEESGYVLMPEVHREHWIGGPPVVKLGTTELSNGPLRGRLPGMLSNDIDKGGAIRAIENLNELRNAAAHPDGKEVFPQPALALDLLLARGHRAAVALQNFRRADQFDKLRDELEEEAYTLWNEIAHPPVPHTPRTKFGVHHEKLFELALKFPYRIPDEIIDAAKTWNLGGHPHSDCYPQRRQLTEDDDYSRKFGQDESYFRRVERKPFDAGSPDHRAVLRTLGAPDYLATMPIDEMRRQIAEIEARKVVVVIDEASIAEEARIRAEEIDKQVQDAIACGLFSN